MELQAGRLLPSAFFMGGLLKWADVKMANILTR